MAKKEIKQIYPGYFQKSKVFLHPALKHKRGTSITPIETYLEWGDINIGQGKLLELYHLRDDQEFLRFEDSHLLGNDLFDDYIELNENKGLYIFNIDPTDYIHLINGRYSMISQEQKTRIKEYYGAHSTNYAYIDTYLYPENYILKYAEFLTVKERDIPEMCDLLISVGELCSKPDLDKERLKMSVEILNLKKL